MSIGVAAGLGCCGSSSMERFPLHGTVRVDGAAVSEGAISLLPDAGNSGPAASTVIVAGEYAFDDQTGPGSGPYRVVVAVDALATAEDEGAADRAGEEPPDLATMKRSPTRPPFAGTSQAPGASKQGASAAAAGQWETTYTVPQEGDFRKDFEF